MLYKPEINPVIKLISGPDFNLVYVIWGVVSNRGTFDRINILVSFKGLVQC